MFGQSEAWSFDVDWACPGNLVSGQRSSFRFLGEVMEQPCPFRVHSIGVRHRNLRVRRAPPRRDIGHRRVWCVVNAPPLYPIAKVRGFGDIPLDQVDHERRAQPCPGTADSVRALHEHQISTLQLLFETSPRNLVLGVEQHLANRNVPPVSGLGVRDDS